MDVNEVLRLIDAGFTADEIRAMTAGGDARAEPGQEQAAPEPEQAPEKEQAQEQAPGKEQAPEQSRDDAILNRIDALTGTITALLNRSTGARTSDHTETVDDILKKAFFGKEED